MAQYRAGRVTVTTGSDVVVGTDTDWLSNVASGDIFMVRGDEVPYRVAGVTRNNELRLNARYAGPTETNTFYSITRDFTEFLNLPIIRNGDVDAVPLFAEALVILDAKLKNGGGGGGATKLSALSDVTTQGANPGDQLTLLQNGSFGFLPPLIFNFSATDADGDGGRIVKSYTGGKLTLRRLKVSGGTIAENENDLTITLPSPGEVNTLSTGGSAESQSLTLAKQGTALRIKGLRAGPNVTLTPEGNDVVITATGGSGGSITYTMASVGTGASLVATPSGTQFRIKALAFDDKFTTATDQSGALAVALKRVPLSFIDGIRWENIKVGQVVIRDNSDQLIGLDLPAPGIRSLFEDKTPKLGGPLDVSGQRILGQPITFSGTFERPKAKSYTICLSAPAALRLESIVTSSNVGTLTFRVDIGSVPESTGTEAPPPGPLQGTAAPGRQNTPASQPLAVDPGQAVILTLFGISADIEDFTYTLNGTTV